MDSKITKNRCKKNSYHFIEFQSLIAQSLEIKEKHLLLVMLLVVKFLHTIFNLYHICYILYLLFLMRSIISRLLYTVNKSKIVFFSFPIRLE